MGELLEKSGYTVVLLLGKQATQAAVQNAQNKAKTEGTSEGVVLIGMFGHGVQYGNDAYYGPYKTKIREVKDSQGNLIRDKSGEPKLERDPATIIAMRSILDALTVCGADSKILLADCCRDDPRAARGRAFGSNLQKEGLPRGMAALFACSENEQAFESNEWGHGAFTKALLDECTGAREITANTPSDALYRRVGSLVKEKTNGRSKQTVNGIVNGFVDLHLLPSNLPDLMTNSMGMKLKLIAAGEFQMGSSEAAVAAVVKANPSLKDEYRRPERPQHPMKFSRPFYMGATEVTQGEWFEVMRTRPWFGVQYVQEGADYPAVFVSGNDAVSFCRKLTENEGSTHRLPTEAEWEYACRARTDTAYSFGNDPRELTDYGWWGGNNGHGNATDAKYAHIVRTKLPNGFGLYDMHGNVAEWCQDVDDAKAYASRSGTTVDAVSASGGAFRVLRGGSWSASRNARSAHRFGNLPDARTSVYGFRVVR